MKFYAFYLILHSLQKRFIKALGLKLINTKSGRIGYVNQTW